jgi:hypothetical protein
MASAAWQYARPGVWRFSRLDASLVAMAAVHGAVLQASPGAPLVAIGLWWNANTIAHNFIHRPFFRPAGWNRVFSAILSLLLGIPQRLWHDRHLAHHAGVPWTLRLSRQLFGEAALVIGLWVAMAAFRPRWFLTAYLPGYLAGLALCSLQGYWEHAAGTPTSHYGRLYNFLCFNDGYHAEHHADPATHWTELPCRKEEASVSGWPPLLRWLDVPALELLERLVLPSPLLQRFVLRCHRRAFEKLLARGPSRPARPEESGRRSQEWLRHTVVIVGGGLFPRTALILRDLLPYARLIIVDSNAGNLAAARSFLGDAVEYRHAQYSPGHSTDGDLVVVPLCLDGDREALYRHPPTPTIVHDWIWRRRGHGAVVSWLLLKRINLVRP